MISQSCQCDECQVNRRQEPDTTHFADDATLARIAELERQNAELHAQVEALIAKVLPNEPPPGLLMSMAIRFDHGLACPGYYDSLPLYEGCTHEQHLQSTLTQMRQLYEEVSGNGFYRPEKEAEYAAIASEKENERG